MAAWQFQCYIIPLTKNNRLNHDEIVSWNNVEQPLIYPDFLQCGKSWSPNIVQYGDIDKTCIEFIYDEDRIEEINCRLDLRTLTGHVLIQIIEYVQNIDACFLINDIICMPELEIIMPLMKQSRAYQYCKNPLEYLKNIEQSE